MSFEEALNKVIDEYGYDILKDTFRTYSLISDYVGSSFYDTRLAKLFECVYYCFDLYELFSTKGLKDARKFLETKYENFSEYTKREFVDAINPIAKRICPDEYVESTKKTKSNNLVVKNVVKQPSNKKTNPIVVPNVVPNNNLNKISPKKKKRTSNKFSSIKIDGSVKRIKLFYTSDSTKIILNGSTIVPNNSPYANIKNGYLEILNVTGNELKININHSISLKNVSINAPSSIVHLESYVGRSSKTLVVKAKEISNYDFSSDYISFYTTSGDVYSFATCQDIKINTQSGNIRSKIIYPTSYLHQTPKTPDVVITSNSGNIDVSFEPLRIVDGILLKKITKNFSGQITLKKLFTGSFPVSLNLYSKSGKVVCK